MNKPATKLINLILTWLALNFATISTANADTFTEVIVENASPRIYFDDTFTGSGNDWRLGGNSGRFELYDAATSDFVFFINRTDNNAGTLHVALNGNVSLANDAIVVDRSNKRLGIGTSLPQSELHIANIDTPTIRLEQLPGGFGPQSWEIAGNEANFFLRNVGTDLEPFKLYPDAPDNLLVLRGNNVGIGIDNPSETLEVSRDDGTTKILVAEANATAAPRTLFQLFNPGNTKFEITNSDANVSWAFTNSGTDFRVSRQGSGVVEFRVNNAGDAFLEGMLTENSDINSKQDIVAVDAQAVLDKLSALPISEWSYKDAPADRHIGPMAQDFYAAFGLGNSDKGIGSLDSAGVALAAIKALADQNQQLQTNQRKQQILLSQQAQNIDELKAQLSAQQQAFQQLTQRVMNNRPDQAGVSSVLFRTE